VVKPSPSSWITHHQTLLSPRAARLATPYFAALSERLAATLSYYHCHTTISEHFHPTALRLRPFLAVAETEGPIHGCTRRYMYIGLSTSDIFENENEDEVKGGLGAGTSNRVVTSWIMMKNWRERTYFSFWLWQANTTGVLKPDCIC